MEIIFWSLCIYKPWDFLVIVDAQLERKKMNLHLQHLKISNKTDMYSVDRLEDSGAAFKFLVRL